MRERLAFRSRSAAGPSAAAGPDEHSRAPGFEVHQHLAIGRQQHDRGCPTDTASPNEASSGPVLAQPEAVWVPPNRITVVGVERTAPMNAESTKWASKVRGQTPSGKTRMNWDHGPGVGTSRPRKRAMHRWGRDVPAPGSWAELLVLWPLLLTDTSRLNTVNSMPEGTKRDVLPRRSPAVWPVKIGDFSLLSTKNGP